MQYEVINKTYGLSDILYPYSMIHPKFLKQEKFLTIDNRIFGKKNYEKKQTSENSCQINIGPIFVHIKLI